MVFCSPPERSSICFKISNVIRVFALLGGMLGEASDPSLAFLTKFWQSSHDVATESASLFQFKSSVASNCLVVRQLRTLTAQDRSRISCSSFRVPHLASGPLVHPRPLPNCRRQQACFRGQTHRSTATRSLRKGDSRLQVKGNQKQVILPTSSSLTLSHSQQQG